MARLISEDEEVASSIDLRALTPLAQESEQLWQSVSLDLTSGSRQIYLGVVAQNASQNPGEDPMAEICVLCRHPQDEVQLLIDLLKELRDGLRTQLVFEPAEPSFELTLHRTETGGVVAETWIDSGNAGSGYYRWDAIGIRFFTNDRHLSAFISDLENEFLTPGLPQQA